MIISAVANRFPASTAHQRLFHQGAESTLSRQQQHGRLHRHLEHHHGYGMLNDSRVSVRVYFPVLMLSVLTVQFECCGVNSADDFDQQSLFRRLNPGRAIPDVCCLMNEQLMNVDECLRGNMPFRIKVTILRFIKTQALKKSPWSVSVTLSSLRLPKVMNMHRYAK